MLAHLAMPICQNDAMLGMHILPLRVMATVPSLGAVSDATHSAHYSSYKVIIIAVK